MYYKINNLIVYSMVTSLEKQQSRSLYQVVREKYKKTQIKHIDDIIHHMSHSLYHDKRVNHIYSKTAVSQDVLHTLFIHKHTDAAHKKIVRDATSTINYTLEKYRPRKVKRTSCIIC